MLVDGLIRAEYMRELSVKQNIIANDLGKVWTSVTGIVFIPLYIKFLGIQAYSLIGIRIVRTNDIVRSLRYKYLDNAPASCYVHFVNIERSTPPDIEHYRFLRILDELSNNDSLTQRDLSGRLGMALGLVNSYITNLVAKSYIIVKSIPPATGKHSDKLMVALAALLTTHVRMWVFV